MSASVRLSFAFLAAPFLTSSQYCLDSLDHIERSASGAAWAFSSPLSRSCHAVLLRFFISGVRTCRFCTGTLKSWVRNFLSLSCLSIRLLPNDEGSLGDVVCAGVSAGDELIPEDILSGIPEADKAAQQAAFAQVLPADLLCACCIHRSLHFSTGILNTAYNNVVVGTDCL